jgi:hypothetical protein
MMPNVDQDLLSVGQEHQFHFLSQSDINLCTQNDPTCLCKGRDVLRTDLDKTCLGLYCLENIDKIQSTCKFDLIPSQEHVSKLQVINELLRKRRSLVGTTLA